MLPLDNNIIPTGIASFDFIILTLDSGDSNRQDCHNVNKLMDMVLEFSKAVGISLV